MVLLAARRSGVCVERLVVDEQPLDQRLRNLSPAPLETARRLLIHRNLAGSRAVFVPDGAARSCFALLPKMDNRADADSALLLQAQRTLSWDQADPVAAHEDSAFLRDRVGSVVALGDWKEIKTWCALVEGAGGILEEVTVRACAYESLARHQQWAKSFRVVLVADVGAASTHFYVLDRGRVRFIREIPVAGNAITKALTAKITTDKGPLRFTDVEAEEFKTVGSLSTIPDIQDIQDHWAAGSECSAAQMAIRKNVSHTHMMVRPVIERISSDLSRSLQFFQDNAGQKVDAVFLTGGSAGMSALQTQMASAVPVPIQLLDPFTGLKFRDAAVQESAEKHKNRLAVAVGLALGEHVSISLLPRRVRAARRAADFTPAALSLLLAAGFLPLILGVIFKTVTIQSLKPGIRTSRNALVLAGEQNAKIGDLQAQVRTLTDQHRSLQALTMKEPLWAGVLNALSDAVPRDIVLTRLSTSVSAGGAAGINMAGRVLPSGKTFDDAVASLLSELSSSVFFGSVRVAHATAASTPDQLGHFEIHCELVY